MLAAWKKVVIPPKNSVFRHKFRGDLSGLLRESGKLLVIQKITAPKGGWMGAESFNLVFSHFIDLSYCGSLLLCCDEQFLLLLYGLNVVAFTVLVACPVPTWPQIPIYMT